MKSSSFSGLAKSADPLFVSYADLVRSLVEGVRGICLLDESLSCRGQTRGIDAATVSQWLHELKWTAKSRRVPAFRPHSEATQLLAIPVQTTDGRLLAVLCMDIECGAFTATSAAGIAARLKPVISSLHRELQASAPLRSKHRTLTERTEELE